MTAFEGFVEVPGRRLWAEWTGDGTGVVLVHAGIADARMWDSHWAALAARHRVVRYDTRGFGRSETGDVPFSNRAPSGRNVPWRARWGAGRPARPRTDPARTGPMPYPR